MAGTIIKLHSTTVAFFLIPFLTMTACEQMVESKTEPVRKVVFIIVDGISAEILEEVDTPNSDQVIAQGAYTRGWLGREAGRMDEYELLVEVPLNSEKAVVDVRDIPSEFYKIVIEGPYNSVNRWVVLSAEQ